MDIKELKNLTKNFPATLIMEEGEPTLVVLPYMAYKELVGSKHDNKELLEGNPVSLKAKLEENYNFNNPSAASSVESRLIEKLNHEIEVLKTQIESEEKVISEGIDLE